MWLVARARIPVLAGLILTLVLAFTAVPAGAYESAEEGEVARRINEARAAAGLVPLGEAGELSGWCRQHAAAMAAARDLWHDSGYAALGATSEIVGVASGPKRLIALWMQSAVHRDQILTGAFRDVGVGTARDASGALYACVVFRSGGVPVPPAPRAVTVGEAAPDVASGVAAAGGTASGAEPARRATRVPAPAPAPAPVTKVGALVAVGLRATR